MLPSVAAFSALFPSHSVKLQHPEAKDSIYIHRP